MKIIVLVLLAAIVIALFSGLFFLAKDKDHPPSPRLLTALKVRVALSITLVMDASLGILSSFLSVFASFCSGGMRFRGPLVLSEEPLAMCVGAISAAMMDSPSKFSAATYADNLKRYMSMPTTSSLSEDRNYFLATSIYR